MLKGGQRNTGKKKSNTNKKKNENYFVSKIWNGGLVPVGGHTISWG